MRTWLLHDVRNDTPLTEQSWGENWGDSILGSPVQWPNLVTEAFRSISSSSSSNFDACHFGKFSTKQMKKKHNSFIILNNQVHCISNTWVNHLNQQLGAPCTASKYSALFVRLIRTIRISKEKFVSNNQLVHILNWWVKKMYRWTGKGIFHLLACSHQSLSKFHIYHTISPVSEVCLES